MMRLSQLLEPRMVLLGLSADSKEELIRKVVDHLDSEKLLSDPGAVQGALMERERVMSTGIGGGVAIPHAQSPGARSLVVCLVRVARDLDFDALDGKPVRLVFLIVGPEERVGFIRILARISRLLYSGDLQEDLLSAASPEEIIGMIRNEEEKLHV